MNGPLLFKCVLHSSGVTGSTGYRRRLCLTTRLLGWGGVGGLKLLNPVLQFGFGMSDCTFVLILSILGMSGDVLA